MAFRRVVATYPAPPCTCTLRSATRPRASEVNSLQQAARSEMSSPRSWAREGLRHHGAGGDQLGFGVGDHGLDQLEVGDGPPELPALDGVGDHLVEDPLGEAGEAGRDPSLPRSSTFMATRNPWPSTPPSRASAGTGSP